jgi:dihydrofolate synthase/folylpolyglutamate synthase
VKNGIRAAFAAIETRLLKAASPGIRPGLSRLARLLRRLGNPENDFPAIHVVGTNGKGSTAASLDAIFRCSGRRSALYTSPHLDILGERLRMNGTSVSPTLWEAEEDMLYRALREDPFLRQMPPTFFELLTALCFCVLRSAAPDVVVMEAGMGGRLDATNAAKQVLLSVITPVALDHEEYLGTSLHSIGMEKFAVVRPRTPALYSGEPPELEELFLERCSLAKAEPYVFRRTWRVEHPVVEEEGCSYELFGPGFDGKVLKTSLVGRHQINNSALAAAGAILLGQRIPGITSSSIQAGLKATDWPGRGELLPGSPPILLDGAHNPHGARALASLLRDVWGKTQPKTILFAAMRDKDSKSSLELLRPVADRLICTSVPGMSRCETSAVLVEMAKAAGWTSPVSEEDPLRALAMAEQSASMVVVCGSLYLVGWMRSRLVPERRIDFA